MTLDYTYRNCLELINKNRLEEAENNLKQLFKDHPENCEVINTLAVCFIRLGKKTDAYDLLYKSLKNNIFNENLLLTFANLLYETEEYTKSLNIFSEGNRIYTKNENFLYGMALNEEQLGNAEAAIDIYDQLIENNNKDERYFINRSSIYIKLEKYEDALNDCNYALELNPNNIHIYKNKASALVYKGDNQNASKCFIKIIDLDENNFESIYNLSGFENLNDHPLIVKKLLSFKNLNHNNVKQSVYANFALSKYYEKKLDFKQVWDHLNKANNLISDTLNYHPDHDANLFAAIKLNNHKVFDLARQVEPKLKEYDKFNPIFILGMPRSGTSLVEQIISSHPEVDAYGERVFFSDNAPPVYLNTDKASSDDLISMKLKYLENICHNSSTFFTDKHPLNFKFIGLITEIFPSAKIIDVRRSPQAVCWSNYKHYFVKHKGLEFSFDLNHIVKFYHLYDDMMQFWKELMPQKIYELNYQKLTENKDEEIKKLLDFIGLQFNSACLYPEKNKNIMKTASRVQVTKPIYTGSSDDWRNYEEFLSPSFELLSK